MNKVVRRTDTRVVAYDAGNRLQAVAQGANVTTITYDANGNLSTENLGGALTTYQYDPENRLTGIVNPDGARSMYTYSGTGLRRTAQEPGAQTLFVWDGDDYLQERAASTVLYVVQDGEVLAEKRSGVRNWYVPDPLGSTSLLLDASLSVTDRFEYWPYGEERVHTGSSVTPFRYVGTLGYYRDATSRLYVRARVLRPDYGRWLTEDPIGFAGGDVNLYGYVRDSLTTQVDPSGFRAEGIDVCGSNTRTGRGGKPKPKTPCPGGGNWVCVTCYGRGAAKSDPNAGGGGISYPTACRCGGQNRAPGAGDCAIDRKHPACPPGWIVSISDGKGLQQAQCRACDAGQGWRGIDFYVDVPDGRCQGAMPGVGLSRGHAWYCVQCETDISEWVFGPLNGYTDELFRALP